MTHEKSAVAPSATLPVPDEHDLSTRLAVAVGRINRRIRPTRDGISHGLVSALGTIVRLGGKVRPGDLARIEAVAAPTMTRIVADLESKGFIRREADPSDGRSFFVVATAAGEDAIRRARFERAERISGLISELSAAEYASLENAIGALENASVAGLPQTVTR